MTVENALEAISLRTGQTIYLQSGELSVAGCSIQLPLDGKWDDLHARHALPFSARGDARENLLYSIVQGAGPGRRRVLDVDLYDKLPSAIDAPGILNTETVAEAMRREYWYTPSEGRGEDHHLIPFQAELPTGFDHTSRGKTTKPARYKMFDGYILPFLTWDGSAPDVALIDELLNAIARTDGFTLLDRLFLDAARSLTDGEAPPLTSSALLRRAREGRDGDMLAPLQPEAGGPFCQHSFDRFREDMRTVLRSNLPRAELVRAMTLVLSLHLAVYYYRFALVLAQDVEAVINSGSGSLTPAGCPCVGLKSCSLAGEIKFRSPSNGFRPVSTQSPCRQSYLKLDRDRLLALSANIVTANLFERAWAAISGEPSSEGAPRPRRIASGLIARPDLWPVFDAATAALAVLYAQQAGKGAVSERVANRAPGPFALRSAVTQGRRTVLRHTSRAVVNDLAHRPGEGTLLRRNGRSLYYFELDDDMLFLLVKLICQRQTVPLEAFLEGLAQYGLCPQDDDEVEALSMALERFGMLDRYSDAGESTFVHDLG